MHYQRAFLLFVLIFLPLGLLACPSWAQTTTDRTISIYQRQIQRKPSDATAYYRLGDAYIQKARESGDTQYINLAEQALRKSLEIAPNQGGPMRHLAYVLYYRHAFEEAALQATKALSADPSDAQSYGIMGDAYYEMGQYDRAQEAYERMIALRKDLYSYSRLAGLKSIRGDVEGAIADLEKAIQDGRENSRPGESIAWIQWQLGMEHFAIGNLKEAEGKFTEALKSHPDYYRALAGLGLVRGSQKRYPEAIDLYRKAIATNPHPNYIAALGDVYQKAGRFDEAQKQYSLIEQMDPKAANKNFDERDLAYFYADHDIKLNESLELAKMELEERKDIYAYDLMAWTLYKNGKPQEALTAITEALKLGTKDAKLFFHAGMIYYRLGEAERAKIYLRRALATNPYFHPFFVDVVENTFREIDQGGLPHSSIK